MPRYNFGNTPGAGDSNSTYTDRFFYYDTTLPTGRTAANGTTPILVTAIEAVANGVRGNIGALLSIADGGTGNEQSGTRVTLPGASRAQTAVNAAVSKGFLYGGSRGQTARIRLDLDGLAYAGRNTGGPGTLIGNGGLARAGSLAGGLYYTQVPAAPSAPTVRPSADGTSAFVQFTGSSDNGESAITGWRLQYSERPDFVGNVIIESTGTSTVTGLTPGVRYYWRAIGRNAVSSWAGAIGGVWSAVTSAVQTVTAPAIGGRVFNGQAWVKPRLRVFNGSTWVDAKVKVFNGQAWVNPR